MSQQERGPAIESAMTIVPVRDVRASIAFYADILGFETRFLADDGSFAMVMSGQSFGLQLLACDDPEALKATANNIAVYFHVTELDRFYEGMKTKLESLPEGRLRPPFDQAYGMREFHVKDPDGCLLFFGEEI